MENARVMNNIEMRYLLEKLKVMISAASYGDLPQMRRDALIMLDGILNTIPKNEVFKVCCKFKDNIGG